MTLSKSSAQGTTNARSLLMLLIDSPDLARSIQALPAASFSAMVREIGVEDAAELVALATTEQLVQAFDEDLFTNDRAGERERFDGERFVAWLEVLLEAGDQAAARRIAELDEDFVGHALGSILLVLDDDALREHLDAGDADEALRVDKALESALAEELDGYILVAKQHTGWDAALALILALDRDHRPLLERLLERMASVSRGYLDDLDELATVLSEGESLAEDVEAAREERRGRQGYVEPRAARAFLQLAKQPLPEPLATLERDPLSRAYFRELDRAQPRRGSGVQAAAARPPEVSGVLVKRAAAKPSTAETSLEWSARGSSAPESSAEPEPRMPLSAALQALRQLAPASFDARMEELAYLANVLVAGAQLEGQRVTPQVAAGAVLATVAYGALLEAKRMGQQTLAGGQQSSAQTTQTLAELLRTHSADVLFRRASSALHAAALPSSSATAVLWSAQELAEAQDS